MYRKRMSEALEEARSYRDPVNEDRGFTSQQIKMAYGVLNDPRYKQGNYSGAYAAIEKIAKGLANHPDVANALRRANEELEETELDEEKYVVVAKVKGKLEKITKPLDKKQAETYAKRLQDDMKIAVAPYNFASDIKIQKEETIKEYKKMTVTFKDMASMSKASTDLAKYGFTIDAKGLVMKVDGKGADLNAIGTDLQNFYGAKVVAENLEETPTTPPIPDNVKHLFDKDKNFKDDKSKQKFINMVKTGQVKGMTPSMVDDLTEFTKKEFDRNEDENEHGLNAKKVVDMFGTGAEKMKIDAINARHNMRGSISREDQRARDEIVNKYYPRLK